MAIDCIIIQEVKNKIFVILSRRKMHNISLRFIVHIILHGYGLQYNTRSKRVNEEIILQLINPGRPVSMQNFRFIVHIVYLYIWSFTCIPYLV